MDAREAFLGVEFMGLDVQPDGAIEPPPAKASKDLLRVHSAFHIGPNVYTVINFTKMYQCFVEVKKEGRAKMARCAHANCYWISVRKRPTPCKHIRSVVKYHVKLMRRVTDHRPRPIRDYFLDAIGE